MLFGVISLGVVKIKEIRLVTAALPYVNNIPHLGHIVGSHLPADIFARFSRLRGYDTLFVGGSDENGTPSEIAAESIGIDIATFCAKLHKEHKKIYDWFNISYDNFSRTSSEIHHKITQEFFLEVYKKGFISKGKLSLFFCENDKRFLPDRYVEGTCAKCGYEHANGDQCEKCTAVIDVKQLHDPKCRICGKQPIIRESDHLFFKLDMLSDKLESWIRSNSHWRSQVSNLALGWLKEGLKERCITRDLKHGVVVPLPEFKDKVFYVWFDAPIGYISAVAELSKSNIKKFWKNSDSKVYHFLGKDNIPFHSIFWPAMLIANGNYNLPYNVVGLQYLNYEGGKFSKSQKRGVFCERLPDLEINSDVLRAYLTFLIPENDDSEFKWNEFQTRINSDIIGNYGNFVNRTLTFIANSCGSSIKKPAKLNDADKAFVDSIRERISKITELLEAVQLRPAFQEILALSADGNKYFNDNQPWKLVKENPSRTKEILYLCASLCRSLAIVSSPYLPLTSLNVWKQLKLSGSPDKKGIWDTASDLAIPASHKIGTPALLFTKLTDDFIENMKKIVSQTKELKDIVKKA